MSWRTAPLLLLSLVACRNAMEPTVGSVAILPDSVGLLVGTTAQLSATIRDGNGAPLAGRMVTWTSADPSTATVSGGGLVTAVGPGRAVITGASEGKSGTAVVNAMRGDFAVTGAQITQGVQASDGSIPIVLSGGAAAVNVLIRGPGVNAPAMQIVLRLFDAGGAMIRSDTVVPAATLGEAPTVTAPSVQFLVPAPLLQAGVQWELARDPKGLVPDDTAANDVYPRSGRATLATAVVPTLKIRFVPIVLSSHGNTTGQVSTNTLAEYLRTLKSVHPVSTVIAEIGTPFTTSANFGTPPAGGSAPFWQQVLGELDLARTADATDPLFHWYGVVVPPPGFNFTNFGGFAYIPTSGQATGPGTRTATSVQVGWFNRQSQARELVAHELGHNFGRRHAPCGNPDSPDPGFPNSGGTIGAPGHDVYSWAAGLTGTAAVLPATTGDIMGYCFPPWASEYTWRGVFAFRQPPTAGPPQPAPRVRALVVRGAVDDLRGVTLDPAFVLDARPTPPESTGPYHLEGRAADGSVLFSRDFAPSNLDHTANVHHFTYAIPVTPDLEQSLAALEVRGPAGVARVARAPLILAAAPAIARLPGGTIHVSCADPAATGILVQDGVTGTVLGTAPMSSMTVTAAPGVTLSVACSNGVGSARAAAVVP